MAKSMSPELCGTKLATINGRRLARTILAALAMVLVGSRIADARVIESWTYSALLAKSDVVVIAMPTATHETQEIAALPHIMEARDGGRRPVMGVGVETTFRVAACLKGQIDSAAKLVLHHYAARTSNIVNGPMLVSFAPGSPSYYLMFLVREHGGRFAPTGGQTDPAAFGIHKLSGFAR